MSMGQSGDSGVFVELLKIRYSAYREVETSGTATGFSNRFGPIFFVLFYKNI